MKITSLVTLTAAASIALALSSCATETTYSAKGDKVSIKTRADPFFWSVAARAVVDAYSRPTVVPEGK